MPGPRALGLWRVIARGLRRCVHGAIGKALIGTSARFCPAVRRRKNIALSAASGSAAAQVQNCTGPAISHKTVAVPSANEAIGLFSKWVPGNAGHSSSSAPWAAMKSPT